MKSRRVVDIDAEGPLPGDEAPLEDQGGEPSARSLRVRAWRKRASALLDSLAYQLAVLVLVFYVLYAVDVAQYLGAPSSADAIINAFLAASMAAFAADIGLQLFVGPRGAVAWAGLALDVLATAAVLVDITWVADAARISAHPTTAGGSAVTLITQVNTQAARVLRLLRVIRVIRVAAAASALVRGLARRRCGAAGGAAPAGDEGAISAAISEATALLMALVVILGVIAAMLLAPTWQGNAAALEGFVAALDVRAAEGAGREQLEPLVAQLVEFSQEKTPREVPLRLTVGEWEWTWWEKGSFNDRLADKVSVTVGSVLLEVEVSARSRRLAVMDMALVTVVVGLLLLFVAALNFATHQMLVRPLERIFRTIRENAAQVVEALGTPEEKAKQTRGEQGVETIEAAVLKMARIVSHFTAEGGQGAALAKTMAAGADQSTREWLATMVGEAATQAGDALPGGGTQGASGGLTTRRGQRGPRRGSKLITQLAQLALRASPAPSVQGDLALSGLGTSQLEALAAVDVPAMAAGLGFNVLSVPRSALVPHLVALFLDMGLAGSGAGQGGGGGGGGGGSGALLLQQAVAGGGLDPAADWKGAVPVDVLWRFVEEVSRTYHDVPYHNFHHCADVVHTVYCFVRRVEAAVLLSRLEKLALMLAALCHDMDHPGVSNAYLVAARHGLATTYNDTSVLENRHVACLYGLLASRPELNVLAGLAPAEWRDVRRIVIGAVLQTDMTHHFPMVSKLEVFYELHGADIAAAYKKMRQAMAFRPLVGLAGGVQLSGGSLASSDGCLAHVFASAEDRQTLLNVLLHCADVSNPVKPGPIAEQWADRVLAEFFAQGDAEARRGLPASPLCDRRSTSRPASQANFIEFVVAPLFAQVARIFPQFSDTMDQLVANRRHWHEALVGELGADVGRPSEEREGELQKAAARLAAFEDKYSQAAKLQRQGSSTAAGMGIKARAMSVAGSSVSSLAGLFSGAGGSISSSRKGSLLGSRTPSRTSSPDLSRNGSFSLTAVAVEQPEPLAPQAALALQAAAQGLDAGPSASGSAGAAGPAASSPTGPAAPLAGGGSGSFAATKRPSLLGRGALDAALLARGAASSSPPKPLGAS